MKVVIAAVVVSAVILAECALAFLLIPGTATVEARLNDGAAAPADASKDADKADKTEKDVKDAAGKAEVETDLGKYNIVVHQPATGVTLRINFHLFGTVPEENQADADALAKKNQHRLRDSVIVEIRNSDIADLTDPGLALIKRKILAKSNELLGQPLLKGVVFSDFSFVEQ